MKNDLNDKRENDKRVTKGDGSSVSNKKLRISSDHSALNRLI